MKQIADENDNFAQMSLSLSLPLISALKNILFK